LLSRSFDRRQICEPCLDRKISTTDRSAMHIHGRIHQLFYGAKRKENLGTYPYGRLSSPRQHSALPYVLPFLDPEMLHTLCHIFKPRTGYMHAIFDQACYTVSYQYNPSASSGKLTLAYRRLNLFGWAPQYTLSLGIYVQYVLTVTRRKYLQPQTCMRHACPYIHST